jgi:3-dehydroquinate dehydratase
MDVLEWSRHFRCFPGQGEFDLAGFLAPIIKSGYTGPLSLEIFNDGFRAAPTRANAADGLRSLLYLEEKTRCAGIVINPAAWTHTSVAIRDALVASEVPVIEVHLSNVHAREAFRHHSFVSPIAKAVLAGFGSHGYHLALEHFSQLLKGSAR